MGKKGPADLNKKTIPQLQNTLWPIFARYIKKSHSIDGQYCACITCQKVIEIGTHDCHAGHWIPRSYSPTKYEEDNVRPQCGRCNGHSAGGFAKHSGRPIEFERALKLQIGDERVEELKVISTSPWKWDRAALREQIEYYKTELKGME